MEQLENIPCIWKCKNIRALLIPVYISSLYNVIFASSQLQSNTIKAVHMGWVEVRIYWTLSQEGGEVVR